MDFFHSHVDHLRLSRTLSEPLSTSEGFYEWGEPNVCHPGWGLELVFIPVPRDPIKSRTWAEVTANSSDRRATCYLPSNGISVDGTLHLTT